MRRREETVKNILEVAGALIADRRVPGLRMRDTGQDTPPPGPLCEGTRPDRRQSALRASVERAVAHLKNWKVRFPDGRRPFRKWGAAFPAAMGVHFFSMRI